MFDLSLTFLIFVPFAQSSNEPTAFAIVDKEYGTLKGVVLEVEQMPRIRFQDSVPDCWGLSNTIRTGGGKISVEPRSNIGTKVSILYIQSYWIVVNEQ